MLRETKVKPKRKRANTGRDRVQAALWAQLSLIQDLHKQHDCLLARVEVLEARILRDARPFVIGLPIQGIC